MEGVEEEELLIRRHAIYVAFKKLPNSLNAAESKERSKRD